MYVHVSLLNGFSTPLIYKIPAQLDNHHLIGLIVHVPLRNRAVPAIVINQLSTLLQQPLFEIKEIIKIEPIPDDHHYYQFINYLSATHHVSRIHFIKRVRQFLIQKTALRQAQDEQEVCHHTPSSFDSSIVLTPEQQAICAFLKPYITTPTYIPTLMHGVTGSGKTEVYKRLILETIATNKTVILLLPEVTLALQFQTILANQLPESITMIGFHSGASVKEKKNLWKRLLEQKPTLIIGVHLPILLPIANLGLIIVDEEHEHGYQEKRHPKIHTRIAALKRAEINNIPILLGSATPSMDSLYRVKTQRWKFFQLKHRFKGQLPTVQQVFLPNSAKRKNFWISAELEAAIAERLAKKEQIIIFLNRRGFSFFVQCAACTFLFECAHCSVSLTLHNTNTLQCHYCDYHQDVPPKCPKCKADEATFIKKGLGTQQVVQILQKLFPHARIARADMDTTTKKISWQQTITDFEQNNLDILVGTQSITKGFHFPNVTLVGIIWADLNLHFPVFNATENTLQQLIQVAGRAGRGTQESTVIIQSLMDHHVYNYLNEIDYLQFYRTEIEKRTILNYPPCGALVEIELKNSNEKILESDAHNLAQELHAIAQNTQQPCTILGPVKPPISKIKGTHMQTIYLKGATHEELGLLFKQAQRKHYTSHIFYTPVF